MILNKKMIDLCEKALTIAYETNNDELEEVIHEMKATVELKDDDVSDEEMLPYDCLHIKGFLTKDYDYMIAVSDNQDQYDAVSIIEQIERYADTHGFLRKKTKGLGGKQSIIRNVNMRVYFTKHKCSLCNAQQKLDELMYSGELVTDTSYVGYSEYTITGLDLDEFTIGGHDLAEELSSHMGEYIHMIIECE